MNHAILYLDNLDLVQFETREEYVTASTAANHMLRPYLSLGLRDRGGRKVWCTRAVHYFDPVKTPSFVAQSLS